MYAPDGSVLLSMGPYGGPYGVRIVQYGVCMHPYLNLDQSNPQSVPYVRLIVPYLGGGFQAALNEEVFAALLAHFEVESAG